MRRLTLLCQTLMLLILAGGELSAQSFGVKAGMNLSKMTDYLDDFGDINMKPGFLAGPMIEYNVADNFYLQSGLLFSQKGLKINSDYKISIYYLEIPVTLLNKFEVDPVTVIYGAGPYFAYGLKSKLKVEGDDRTVIEDVDLGYDHDDDRFIPSDFGIGLNAGVEYSSMQVNLEFGLGLTDIAHREPSMFNRRFGITFAYLIN